MLAAHSDSVATVRAVLDAGGADLEARDEGGYTAFLLACWKGDADSVAALAAAGCNTHVINSNGQTGVMLGAACSSEATVWAVMSIQAKQLKQEALCMQPTISRGRSTCYQQHWLCSAPTAPTLTY